MRKLVWQAEFRGSRRKGLHGLGEQVFASATFSPPQLSAASNRVSSHSFQRRLLDLQDIWLRRQSLCYCDSHVVVSMFVCFTTPRLSPTIL